jgi:hypothetical protein
MLTYALVFGPAGCHSPGSKGGHSLRAVCSSGGAQIDFEVFGGSADCTGASQNATQLTDICQQGGMRE